MEFLLTQEAAESVELLEEKKKYQETKVPRPVRCKARPQTDDQQLQHSDRSQSPRCSQKEIVVKTIGRDPDVTPICTSATMHTITFIVCKIRTERSVGEECRLLYQHGEDFVHECGSGFRLTTEKETVLLHLSGLSPVDSGEYTCECSHTRGTDVLHLIVTVKGDDKNSTSAVTMLSCITVIGCGTALTTVSGVVLGLVLRKKCCRSSTRSGSSGLSVCATSCSLDKDEPDNLYTSLGQPAGDLYQTMSVPLQHKREKNSATNNKANVHVEQESGGKEIRTDVNDAVYEVI